MKNFIVKKFGNTYADSVYKKVYARRDELLQEFLSRDNNEQVILKDKILPVISLYEVMNEDKDYRFLAIDFVKEYMFDYAILKEIKRLKRMESLPFFELRFKRYINKIAKSGYLKAVLDIIENGYKFDIESSLWNEIVMNENHPELKDYYYEVLDHLLSSFTKYEYSKTTLKNNHIEIKLIKKE